VIDLGDEQNFAEIVTVYLDLFADVLRDFKLREFLNVEFAHHIFDVINADHHFFFLNLRK
jgi:hypothetical protein